MMRWWVMSSVMMMVVCATAFAEVPPAAFSAVTWTLAAPSGIEGRQLQVMLTRSGPLAESDRQRAALLIARPGAEPTDYLVSAEVYGAPANLVLALPPGVVGVCELRLALLDASGIPVEIVKATPLELLPAPPPTLVAQLVVEIEDTTLGIGQPLRMTFSEPLFAKSGEQFWVTLVEPDTPEPGWAVWSYVAEGAMTFELMPGPDQRGEHEVRMHARYPTLNHQNIFRKTVFVLAPKP